MGALDRPAANENTGHGRRLKKLCTLDLHHTQVTDAGLDEFEVGM